MEIIFDLAPLVIKKQELEAELHQEDSWKEPAKVKVLSKKVKHIDDLVDGYNELTSDSEYLQELLQLDDESLLGDMESFLSKLSKAYQKMELQTILNAPHDSNDVLFTINAGAGGTDAQDWAEMLLRMYTRWVERKKFKYEIIDISEGDEAGIKSVTLLIYGSYAYGLLKSEHGIHRLVRLSPFNSNNKRQTSFASVDVIPQIEGNTNIGVKPDEIRVDTYRASGAGGQHVNKTDSAVRITHLETNIVVQCQSQRSQIRNKEMAMRVLLSRLVQHNEEQQRAKSDKIAVSNKEISWGNQIRSYVFHPYNMVKDHRTSYEESNVQSVMDGNLDGYINNYLHFKKESVT